MFWYGQPFVSAWILLFLAGCPWDAGDKAESGDEPGIPSGLAGIAGAAAAASVEAAIANANAARFPPAPSEDTLCRLRFEYTEYADVKELLGKPQTEGMDAMNASMSYRFSRPKNEPRSQAPAAHADQGVMLYLSFAWKSGARPGVGRSLQTERDKLSGYILHEASISGLPYPKCWPHIEPEGAD